MIKRDKYTRIPGALTNLVAVIRPAEHLPKRRRRIVADQLERLAAAIQSCWDASLEQDLWAAVADEGRRAIAFGYMAYLAEPRQKRRDWEVLQRLLAESIGFCAGAEKAHD